MLSRPNALIILLGLSYFFVSGARLSDNPFEEPSEKIKTALLQYRTYHLYYEKSDTLFKQLKQTQQSLLSKQGKAGFDARTNNVWVIDDETHLQRIQQWIHLIDIPVEKILIKAKIVNLTKEALNELGIQWGTQAVSSYHEQGYQWDFSASTKEMNSFHFPIFKLPSETILALHLKALIQNGQAHLISSPELLTNDGHLAEIEAGEEIPYQERTGEGNTSIAFKKAVVKLRVQPTLTPQHHILLQLTVTADQVSPLSVQGVPAIHTQALTTEISVKNGETLALGGIVEKKESEMHTAIPGLSRIPLLGFLFRQQEQEQQQNELFIFITPEIVNSS
ncbi:MAG TPA: secretin N-terminal domain-containing protein [Coxiellaceae bacterium]|nr:secretin N-terminal domain-containing protein [Coxiellaceae bacterium]